MRSFREQTQVLNNWFSQWNRSEQTISLYALLSRVSAEQASFLMLVLEHNLKARSESDKQDLDGVAKQANSADYISRLGQDCHDLGPSRLLSFLLLLQPSNPTAVSAYLKLLPGVLLQSSTSDDGQHLDDCRQLLSLALVHPAFPSQEKTKLRCLLAMLEEQANHFEQNHSVKWPLDQPAKWGSYDGDSSALNGSASPEVPNPVGSRPNAWKAVPPHLTKDTVAGIPVSVTVPNGQLHSLGVSNLGGKPRSRSLMSGGLEAGCSHSLTVSSSSSFDGVAGKEQRSHSLPQPSRSTQSGNGEHNSRNGVWSSERPRITNGFSNPGMKDIPQWLKSLRLHKYQDLFAYMTYEDMMRVTEEELEGKNVTKGARHKIVSSIHKLKDRLKQLEVLEEEIGQPGKQMQQVVQELKAIVLTPILPRMANYPPHDPTVSRPSSQRLGDKDDSVGEFQGSSEGARSGGDSENGEVQADTVKRDDIVVMQPALCDKSEAKELASKFISVVEKAFNYLLKNGVDDETFTVFATVLDMTLKKEAFSVEQRKRVFTWRQYYQQEPRRVQRRCTEPKRFGNSAVNAGHGNGYPGFAMIGNPGLAMIGNPGLHPVPQQKAATLPGASRTRRSPRACGATVPGGSSNGVSGKPFGVVMVGHPGVLASGSGLGVRVNAQNRLAPSRSTEEQTGFLVRAKSVPAADTAVTGCDGSESSIVDGSSDRDHYMETLCIQVTEHALSDAAEGSAGY